MCVCVCVSCHHINPANYHSYMTNSIWSVSVSPSVCACVCELSSYQSHQLSQLHKRARMCSVSVRASVYLRSV